MEPQSSSCSKPLAALRPAPGTAVKVAGRARLLLGLIPAPHASRGSSLPDRFLPTAPDQFLLVTTLRPWLEIRAASSGLSYARRLLTSLSCLVPRGSALPQIPSPTFVAGWGGRGGRRTWLDWEGGRLCSRNWPAQMGLAVEINGEVGGLPCFFSLPSADLLFHQAGHVWRPALASPSQAASPREFPSPPEWLSVIDSHLTDMRSLWVPGWLQAKKGPGQATIEVRRIGPPQLSLSPGWGEGAQKGHQVTRWSPAKSSRRGFFPNGLKAPLSPQVKEILEPSSF